MHITTWAKRQPWWVEAKKQGLRGLIVLLVFKLFENWWTQRLQDFLTGKTGMDALKFIGAHAGQLTWGLIGVVLLFLIYLGWRGAKGDRRQAEPPFVAPASKPSTSVPVKPVNTTRGADVAKRPAFIRLEGEGKRGFKAIDNKVFGNADFVTSDGGLEGAELVGNEHHTEFGMQDGTNDGVEFYPQRQSIGRFKDELRRCRTAKGAWLIGGAAEDSNTLGTTRFTGLILLAPNEAAVKAIERIMRDSDGTVDNARLSTRVKGFTDKAISMQVPVRWCRDLTASLLTFGNPPEEGQPPADDAWVMIEPYLPGIEADDRPIIKVMAKAQPKLYAAALRSFNKLWDDSVPVRALAR